MAKEYKLTQEALDQINAELDELKLVKRQEIKEKIKIARSYGDLSENAEYDAAREEQAKNESRIQELEAILQNYTLVDESQTQKNVVNQGATVVVKDVELKESFTYKIVGFAQADPANGKISDESPVGKALIGHKKGEKVLVEAPAGEFVLKIESIKY